MTLAVTRRTSWAVVLAATALAGVGCTGTVWDPGVEPGGGPGPDGPGEYPAPTTRVPRLTHAQWENTVQALFELDAPTGLSSELRSDPTVGGFVFDNNGLSMEVDQALWAGYQRAASQVAAQITSDPTLFDRVVPAGADDDARARAFVEQVGMRAYRRPLESAEVDELLAVYQTGTTSYSGVPALEAGIRLTIEALLQSPHFLYRVERSNSESSGAIPLSDWEIATRLSYALWNTMPDEALFAAASAGELHTVEQVTAHAFRMLDDPRADDVVASYHFQLLDMEKYMGIRPSTDFFPDVSPELATMAEEESDLFIRDVFGSGGSYGDILTSTRTFVNAELARIYGVEGTYGDELVPADLDPTERRGIFTHVGFLASNATSSQPDPIHRGVFLAERIACLPIGVPPGMIPPLPAPEGRTNRETVADHTETPGSVCATCHATLINPFGYPYEMFDAIGQLRTEDNGFPVDTSAAPRAVEGEPVPVADALELADVLATSSSVHECYAEHWLEYALGRPHVERDEALVSRLGALSVEGASVRELIVALVTSSTFLSRSTEELPEVSP